MSVSNKKTYTHHLTKSEISVIFKGHVTKADVEALRVGDSCMINNDIILVIADPNFSKQNLFPEDFK